MVEQIRRVRGGPLTYCKNLQLLRMTATKNGFSEENFYAESRQLFESYRESLRGWMARDAHSELEKAINNCVQNVIDHVENEKIPSERLPPNLRDPTTSTNFVKFFAAQSMIEALVGVTIGAAKRGHTEPVERRPRIRNVCCRT